MPPFPYQRSFLGRRSPPDADHRASHASPASSAHPGADFDLAGQRLEPALERTRFQSRRTSTLSYQSPAARGLHDRSYSRSPKSLVVVIPPPDFPLHQGQLGNVLSTGPRHRLPQGMLMPLFSSMFGQLNAIAREFNFPSTTGLCLYLHINENGITMTPRISDDSWQYLFGHLFEGRPSFAERQLPIGGSIEFDIDLNKARWFDAWVSGTLRDSDPFPPVVTSQAPLGSHWREESQTMHTGDQPVEDRWDASGSHTLVNNWRPEALHHLPKKLSLVGRLESNGLHVPSKLQNHADRPDLPQTHGTDALSPAPESAIPHVLKSDLEHRVNSWRATTVLYPVSMTETYQPAPDVEMSAGVTAMDEYALGRNFRSAVNLDEYLWSVTCAGPQSPVIKSPIRSSRPSSVHLDRRANNRTVPRTPTTATTWGPPDDEWYSVVSSISPLPSPDIGERMVEDVMAPRPRAVWGNSFGWRYATTWKKVYPFPTGQTKPTIQIQPQDPHGLVPQCPNLVIYPAAGSHPDARSQSTQSVWKSSFGWQRAETWKKVYPYSVAAMHSVAPIPSQLFGAGGLVPQYPHLRIYPEIYPYLEIYPAPVSEEDILPPVSVTTNNTLAYYPTLVIYPSVYPHFDIYPRVPEGGNIKKSSLLDTSIYSLSDISTYYPNLVIYPAVYPRFDLYPRALEIDQPLKQDEAVVKSENSSYLTTDHPIYPGAYPTQDTEIHTSRVAWGISFGWLTAKTWLHVYPLHIATPLTTRQAANDLKTSISGSYIPNPTTVDIVSGKLAIWGSSFRWKSTKTWCEVWRTASASTYPNVCAVSVRLGQESSSLSNYPHLIIYPAVYPKFNLYPPCAATVEETGSQTNNQCTVSLIPRYPNLVIYPAVYPHIDVYPSIAEDLVSITQGRGQVDIRRRRIEMWRARTGAQVGLEQLLANNHIWEADEPLRVDLADYAWCPTSAGPPTSSAELPLTPSISGSIHLDRRTQGSVLLTPSTATTPPDDDWCSDVIGIDRLPSPDLGQRVLDDVDSTDFTHQPWHLVWPFFRNSSEVESPPSEKPAFVQEYPHLVIYPPTYPHFELYPGRVIVPTKAEVAKTLASPNRYPVLNICPAIYPYLDIYPAIDLHGEVHSRTAPDVWHELVEVRLPSLYPSFDIYPACYPYNLDHVYPSATTRTLAEVSCSNYPWLVIYPPVYPFVIPYPGCSAEARQPLKPQQLPLLSSPERKAVHVKLRAQYPTLDIYPAGYPWSLESIYPATSVDDSQGVIRPQYPCVQIYTPVYPFVEPYPGLTESIGIPGELDEAQYASAKAYLVLSEFKHIDLGSARVEYPYFDLYPTPLTLPRRQERAAKDADVLAITLPQMPAPTWRARKTHMELHAVVFRCLEKQPVRKLKTHLQLHVEVFQDSPVWTPSGYAQDLSSLTIKKWEDIPVQRSQRWPKDDSMSRPGTLPVQSPDKVVFPLGQPPALPPISPLRVRSPSQPSPAVSETPMPRVSSPTNAFAHKRTTSSRLTQAVKSMIPGIQRRNSSASPVSPFSPSREEHKDHVRDQPNRTRFVSLADRRQVVVPPLPYISTSEFLSRAPQNSQRKESLVLQRARAYEQATMNQPSASNRVTHSFTLPPLPLPSMTNVVGTIEKTKHTFA